MIETYLLSVVKGGRRGPLDRLALLGLSLLEPVYGLAVLIRKTLYRLGFVPRRRLSVPVISIGNLVAGGTGKTPLAIYLARTFASLGQQPGIVLRGYRGKGEGARLVTKGLSVEETGDEAQLLARSLPRLPVAVGADRYLAGQLAVGNGASVIVLDDGLQYLGLHRDLEIVLLRAREPWDNGHLIPRGLMREGKKGLSRADLIVLTNIQSVDPDQIAKTIHEIKQLNPTTPILQMATRPMSVQPLVNWWRGEGRSETAVEFLNGRSIGAFTAIGYPEKFFETLESLGAIILSREIRPDHDSWSEEDLATFLANSREELLLLTTEKDAVKLERLLSLPIAERIFVLKIQSEFSQEDAKRLETILKELR